jgi:hypothetical protein
MELIKELGDMLVDTKAASTGSSDGMLPRN